MNILRDYIESVKKRLLSQHTHKELSGSIHSVSFARLYRAQEALYTLYVADNNDRDCLNMVNSLSSPITLFLACPDKEQPAIAHIHTVFYVELSFPELYERLTTILRIQNVFFWLERKDHQNMDGLKTVIQLLETILHISVSVTDPAGLAMISSFVNGFFNSYAAELRKYSQLTPPTLEALLSMVKENHLIRLYQDASQEECYGCLAECPDVNFYILISTFSDSIDHYYIRLIMSGLRRWIKTIYNKDPREFIVKTSEQNILINILKGTIQEEQEIRHAFPLSEAEQYVGILLVRFENANAIQYRTVPFMKELSSLFYTVTSTPYRGDLVVFLIGKPCKKEQYLARKDIYNTLFISDHASSLSGINDILGKYQANGAMIYGTMNYVNIRYMYESELDTLRLALKMKTGNSAQHLFRDESFRVYKFIEYGLHAFSQKEPIEQYSSLLHQDAVMLIRYDVRHDTNIAETVLTYLESGCNVLETSRHLFMHRNTVYKRVQKAEDLLGIQFSQMNMASHMVISLMIHKYARDVLGIDDKTAFFRTYT